MKLRNKQMKWNNIWKSTFVEPTHLLHKNTQWFHELTRSRGSISVSHAVGSINHNKLTKRHLLKKKKKKNQKNRKSRSL